MSVLSVLKDFLTIGYEPPKRVELSTDLPDLDTQIAAIRDRTRPVPRRSSVADALSVPAIQRAVTLISHTVGSLSMQGWRNGSPMSETPVVLARPNPYETPYNFYRNVAFDMATRGEAILWIANRDFAGYPLALVNVPPWEMNVQANSANRLRPRYYWGNPDKPRPTDIVGSRYSPANPDGNFVHIMYHLDSTGLRGVGPLQMCGAAVSVAVESQQWATNFYNGGGVPPIVVKSADELDPSVDPVTGLTEAQAFKRDWMAGNPNEPKIVDAMVDSVQQFDFNPAGAQMLEARQYENGDAARMFGIPGTLLEYNMPGSSLTYQSVPDVWIEFLRGCLQPSYLEPIEAQESDILPRTQTARFNTRALSRADIKTRFDVYNIGVPLGVISVEQAKQDEGYLPGDIETMPVPPSPPQAVVGLSRVVRCDGTRRLGGVEQVCGKLLAEHGPFVGTCPRCKKRYPVAA